MRLRALLPGQLRGGRHHSTCTRRANARYSSAQIEHRGVGGGKEVVLIASDIDPGGRALLELVVADLHVAGHQLDDQQAVVTYQTELVSPKGLVISMRALS